MAILALPYDLKGLISLKFWEEDFYLVSHKENKNAGATEIKASQLDQSKLMLLDDGHCLKDHILDACNIANASKHSLKASSLLRNVFQNLQFHYSKRLIVISLLMLLILISLFTYGSENPVYSLGYFSAFFVCLIVFFLISKLIILLLKKFKYYKNISFKVSIKNITQTKS